MIQHEAGGRGSSKQALVFKSREVTRLLLNNNTVESEFGSRELSVSNSKFD